MRRGRGSRGEEVSGSAHIPEAQDFITSPIPTMSGDEMEEVEMDEDEEMEETSESRTPKKKQVYIPGKSKLGKGDTEELEYDPTAYHFLHNFQTEHPCLSVDTVDMREGGSGDYPLSCTIVAGTQAAAVRSNAIVLARLHNIHGKPPKAAADDDDDDDSSSSEEEDEEDESPGSRRPRMRFANIAHHGGINRIRATRISSARVAAVWNEAGKVQIWNLANAMAALEKDKSSTLKSEKPLHTFPGHQIEGFGLDWSRLKEGRLASGDNRGRIYVWEMGEGAAWSINQIPLSGHTSSIEDLQWSPTEENVLASCSSDKSISMWDVRMKPSEAQVVKVEKAHDSDVNVMSWSGREALLLSGGDDGVIKVWDLKTIQYAEPACVLAHHQAPVTSVGWCPGPEGEGTVLAATSEDDQLSIWDIAVEADAGESGGGDGEEAELPPQLLFIHMGQKEVKELRWVPDCTGTILTTALDGFNLFRTISV